MKTTSQKIQEENQKAKSDDNNENSSVKKEIEIAKEDPQDKKIQVILNYFFNLKIKF